jgi:hypothetical protein
MAVLSGKNGTLKLGATVVTPISDWKLTLRSEQAAYVANDTGGAKRRLSGAEDCSGTFRCSVTDDGRCPVRRNQPVTAQFHVDATMDNYYEASIVVEAIDVECDISSGRVVAFTVTFNGDGPVTPHGVLDF